jgi:two-component system, cell cycle response regulator DivK
MAKVLVADDSDIVRKIARMSLTPGGHSIVEAHDGNEAVALARSEHPDIILLDAEMPEMDGWEACKVIKADAATAGIPIIMCTGNDLAEDPEDLNKSGANGYVIKPYDPETILKKIADTLHC